MLFSFVWHNHKLCVKFKHSTQPAIFRSLSSLGFPIQTDIWFWNSEKQRFHLQFKRNKVETAEQDNQFIDDLEKKLEQMKNAKTWDSAKDFVNALKKGTLCTSAPTLLEYAQIVTEEKRKINKGNGRGYQTFCYFLQGIQNKGRSKTDQPWKKEIAPFANKPIDQFNETDINWFVRFLDKVGLHNSNYWKHFNAVVTHYYDSERNGMKGSMKLWMTNKNKQLLKIWDVVEKPHETLTKEQINDLCTLDPNDIAFTIFSEKGFEEELSKQFCKDFCLLMYYLGTRTIDLAHMKIDDLDLDKHTWTYVEFKNQTKKAHRTDKGYITTSIPAEAWDLLTFYMGLHGENGEFRTSGYVFQFLHDNPKWEYDYDTIAEWINVFIKILNVRLEWNKEQAGTYLFRHTCINHLLMNPNNSKESVARYCHTSTAMIDKNYADPNALAKAVDLSVFSASFAG